MNAMNDSALFARQPAGTVKLYAALTGIVLILMMALGLLMRLTQAQGIDLPADLFYQVMTAHGIGMVAIVGLGGAAIMWHYLSQYVELHAVVPKISLGLFLLGVVMVLGGIFGGGFAAGWTFLHPLPAKSMGLWGPTAAAGYMGGVLVVGVGMLVFYLETARGLLRRYGSLGRAMGLPYLLSNDDKDLPPPAVIASAVVTIINLLSILAGAVILTMMLVNLYVPEFQVHALLAKNLIFFFGHVFINSTIYMAVIAVYELLPRYTGRPWKTSKPFVAAWAATCVMVLAVYPHHTLMDFAQPLWAHVLGQVLSYTSALPVLAVTLVATLAQVYRSRLRWDLVSALLVLSIFGWSAGAVPAIIDATVTVNKVMHNTTWVPGHFHFYLLIGVVSMNLAFLTALARGRKRDGLAGMDGIALSVFTIGALGFVFAFLAAGEASVPRRWAAHLPQWIGYDRFGAVCAALVTVTVLLLVLRNLAGLVRTPAANPITK